MYRSICLLALAVSVVMQISTTSIYASSLTEDKSQQGGILSLQDMLGKIEGAPALLVLKKSVEMQEGLAQQASVLPNPEIAFEVDNFEGDNSFNSFDSAETTLTISQLVELGGKWGSRKEVARQEKSAADLEYQMQVQDLYLEVYQSFYAVLAAQETLAQSEQLLILAEQGYRTVAERVEAGKVSPVQELRASVELNMARNELTMARNRLKQSMQALSSLWGDPTPDFESVSGQFDALSEPPEWKSVEATFASTPDVKKWEAALVGKKAALDLEKANSIPDITLTFGIREFRETDEEAYVAGVEFPLPFFDRNQGGRKAARSELSRSFSQRDKEVSRLSSEMRSAYQEFVAAYNQARMIKLEIIPAAEQANEAAQIGYQEGKFDFLEALDAQRTLFEVKAQYIEAFSAYHEARLRVLRLTGQMGPDTKI
jgi:cobalt-zinc-cadmium efflux system outer membrane protein